MRRTFSIAIVLLSFLSSAVCFARRGDNSATLIDDGKPGIHLCKLNPVGKVWRGSCDQNMDGNPVLTISRVEGITTGVFRKGVYPSMAWSGVMQFTDGADGIEIELYDKGAGLIRTDDGWFPVTDFSISDKTVQFKIDNAKEITPSDLDREIVKRAAAILSIESNWNRNDNRQCRPTDKTWSIYCAMEEATTELAGAFHHRRPALEVVRVIIENRTKDKKYQHRLMGYNNDETTKLSDVQSIFAEALSQMNSSSK
ncbi:MAG TPA: hypothetical protein VFC63_19230 [Blastocatellia bacterium]|nr:hypothetical protein [Blastocatellia bacterium]